MLFVRLQKISLYKEMRMKNEKGGLKCLSPVGDLRGTFFEQLNES